MADNLFHTKYNSPTLKIIQEYEQTPYLLQHPK